MWRTITIWVRVSIRGMSAHTHTRACKRQRGQRVVADDIPHLSHEVGYARCPVSRSVPDDVTAAIAAIERDLDHERFKAAIAKTDAIDLEALALADWETLVPIALRCRIYGGDAVDRVVVDARRWLRRDGITDPARAQIHAQIAYSLTAKRCRALASAAADDCEREAPASSLGPSVRG